MKEQDNISLVRQGYEAFNKGDIQQLLSLFSQDIDWEVPEIEGIAFTGKRHGLIQVADFFRQMGEQQEAREFVADEIIDQGSKVVVLGHCTWAVKATGQDFSEDFCHVFELKDGKVTAFKEYCDTYKAAMAYQPRPGTVGAGVAAAAATRTAMH